MLNNEDFRRRFKKTLYLVAILAHPSWCQSPFHPGTFEPERGRLSLALDSKMRSEEVVNFSAPVLEDPSLPQDPLNTFLELFLGNRRWEVPTRRYLLGSEKTADIINCDLPDPRPLRINPDPNELRASVCLVDHFVGKPANFAELPARLRIFLLLC